jgi:hypothetical protein
MVPNLGRLSSQPACRQGRHQVSPLTWASGGLGRVTTDYGTRRCPAEAVMVVVESPEMACPSSEALDMEAMNMEAAFFRCAPG